MFSIASTRCPWTTGRTRPRDRGQSSGSNPAHPGIGARASCWLRTFCHSACSVSHEIVLPTLYSFDATRTKFGLWPNHLYNYSITSMAKFPEIADSSPKMIILVRSKDNLFLDSQEMCNQCNILRLMPRACLVRHRPVTGIGLHLHP